MRRTFIISCVLLVASIGIATSQATRGYSKRILGKWSSSRSGASSIFHSDGSWGVQRDPDPECVQGRWWINGNKLFLTYPEDNGVGTLVHIRTAKYRIIFSSDDRFTTQTAGYKEIYERER
jgi:hypothetical protein